MADSLAQLLDRPGGRTALRSIRTVRGRRSDSPHSALRIRGRWWADFDGTLLPWHEGDPHHWREETLDFFCWRYTPKPGDVVVDLGAGVGTEILTWSELVGGDGVVHAYEAHPGTYSRMVEIVGVNNLTNVRLSCVAVAEKPGAVVIGDDEADWENSIVSVDGRGVTTAGTTLDDEYVRLGVEQVDFLKVNIEGAERYIASHGREALARTRHVAIGCHDFVADETGDDRMRTRAVMEQTLTELGFEFERRADDPRRWIPDYLYGVNTRL